MPTSKFQALAAMLARKDARGPRERDERQRGFAAG
jgi:hypothetical protein